MADFPVTGAYLHHGLNEQNINYIEHEVVDAMADTDTLTLKLPDYVSNDSLPVALEVYDNATPSVRLTTLTVTSHDKVEGKTVMTASGVVPVGAKVLLGYFAAG